MGSGKPENMGAWSFMQRNMKHFPLRVVARPESGSTATGSANVHVQQQEEIIQKAIVF